MAFAELGDCWDEDGCWDITSVATSFTSLCADHVGAEFEALLDVLGVSDHVHVKNAVLVEFLDDVLWWDTDGRDEKTGAGFDGDVDELVELALGVVVAVEVFVSACSAYFLSGWMCLLGLSCTATNLWEQEIDAEWCVLVVQEALQLCDLLAEHVWSVADTADDTDTTGVGHSGGELRTSGHVHASKHDWVLDLEQIGRGGAELLCFRSACLSRVGCRNREIAAYEEMP